MAGYWASSFFAFVERSEVKVHKKEKEKEKRNRKKTIPRFNKRCE